MFHIELNNFRKKKARMPKRFKRPLKRKKQITNT